MKIASVYPIAQLPQKLFSSFSYFVKDHVEQGSFVEIIFNKKTIPAIVDTVEPVSSQKTALRKSSFSLKKIKKVLSIDPPSHPFLFTISKRLAQYYLEPVGSVLKVFIPTVLIQTPTSYIRPQVVRDPFSERQSEIVIGSLEERIHHYKTVIRSIFAKNKSVVILTPTTIVADYLYNILAELPKERILIHGNLSARILKQNVQKLLSSHEAHIVIGTSIMLGCLRGDESVIIIEDADSHHYMRNEHPKIKTSTAFKMFADEIQAKCIEGKYFPSIQDLKSDTRPHYLSSRLKNTETHILVDTSKEAWSPLSTPILDDMRTSPTRTLLFINRKGFYSFIMCGDCERIVLCIQCRAPLTLHANQSRFYLCHRCQKEYPSDMQCASCNGWNLKGYGMGTQRILEKINREFPRRDAWIFDEDTVKNQTQRNSIKKAFLTSTDGILVATEMALEDPDIKAQRVVVVNLDNLFSIPDFRIHEKILSMLVKLEERSLDGTLVIQTRFARHPLFTHVARQDIKGFLLNELSERKAGDLPPYSILIRITIEDRNKESLAKKVTEATEHIQRLTENYSSYPSFSKKTEHHILLTLNHTSWLQESQELRQLLKSFLFDWDIAVNPISVL